MSKLNKMKKSNDGEGKAVKRAAARVKQFENGPKETRHQHHKPGSMNMKKSGR